MDASASDMLRDWEQSSRELTDSDEIIELLEVCACMHACMYVCMYILIDSDEIIELLEVCACMYRCMYVCTLYRLR